MYGLLKKIGDATLVDKSINDLYPGEYHGVIKLPNGKYTWAEYMGPGTRVDIRVPRGDKGLTPIDTAAMGHDIRYNLSSTPEAIRAADKKFNEVIDRLRREGKEDEFNLKQAELIKVKVFLEGNELIRKVIRKFNTRPTDIQNSPELTAKLEAKLKELEQQGYGKISGGADDIEEEPESDIEEDERIGTLEDEINGIFDKDRVPFLLSELNRVEQGTSNALANPSVTDQAASFFRKRLKKVQKLRRKVLAAQSGGMEPKPLKELALKKVKEQIRMVEADIKPSDAPRRFGITSGAYRNLKNKYEDLLDGVSVAETGEMSGSGLFDPPRSLQEDVSKLIFSPILAPTEYLLSKFKKAQKGGSIAHRSYASSLIR
jgi:hypothetical protein